MSTETLLKQLEEYQAIPYRKLVLQILKQQQETIREQKELIESLWAWAEEIVDADVQDYKHLMRKAEEASTELIEALEHEGVGSGNQAGTGSTPDYDASVYTRIM
jgi:uncharacterized membrane-anchored protein YhcB (DUF1043 family)